MSHSLVIIRCARRSIAAATIDAGAELVTFDSDFDRIAQLERTILVP